MTATNQPIPTPSAEGRKVATGDPLDVERLTRAFLNVECGWPDTDHCLESAKKIAAEYVRLSDDAA